MKKIIFPILIMYAVIFGSHRQCTAFSGSDHVRWLIRTFGTLEPKEYPIVSDVRNIFNRVMTAADKRMNRLPKLVILKDAGEPWAMCWRDGTIILTQKAVEFCYQNVGKEIGDARIAFILGHELAHLANDDFWDLEVSQAIRRVARDSKGFQQIHAMFAASEKDAGERQKKELKADGYGLLYAAMAGYSPKAIVDRQGKNFFRKWTNLTTGKIAYAEHTHPEPEQRAIFVLSEMENVKNHLILFDVGVRLCQLGMYKDSLDFMEAFRKVFPCREVFNNIGLIHYQTAVIELAESNQAYPYRLATIADTKTRAGTYRGIKDSVKEKLWKAKRNFKYACEQDRFYIPARVNLSSAFIMDENYAGAVRILNQALDLDKEDPRLLNNLAIAKYLLGKEFQADTSGEAIRILKELTKKHPGYAEPFFNLRLIPGDHEKDFQGSGASEPPHAKSKSCECSPPFATLRKGLLYNLSCKRVHPHTQYIQNTQRECGCQQKKPIHPPPSQAQEGDFSARMLRNPPLVSPGEWNESARRVLGGIPKQTFELKNIFGEYYQGRSFQVLVLEDEIIFVQSEIKEKTDYDAIIRMYGRPHRVSKCTGGITTLVYDRFALDIKDGTAISVIHF